MNPHIPHHKVPHTSIIILSESEVSITVLCLLCSPHYTAVRIENCSKSTSVTKVATMKSAMVMRTQLLSESEVSIALLCQLRSTCYTAVRIKNYLKSTLVIKVTTMKNTDNFLLRKESHHA